VKQTAAVVVAGGSVAEIGRKVMQEPGSRGTALGCSIDERSSSYEFQPPKLLTFSSSNTNHSWTTQYWKPLRRSDTHRVPYGTRILLLGLILSSLQGQSLEKQALVRASLASLSCNLRMRAHMFKLAAFYQLGLLC
jgi:hypothetical protein